MKKSMLAMLCVLGLFAVQLAYAEELPQLNGDESPAVEQLPPLIDPSATPDPA